ncbi:MAG: Gfo/Idh/MocA family oxidoreductase, partial [Clostridia bacterium]|nr:Gfo/Idh/MocA family oxidoreductase [Clostridia bacterium]
MKQRTKLNIAVIGCGAFACSFVPLFKSHPDVACVRVCDLIPERAASYAERFGVDIIPSFEDSLADPTVNAVTLFTQRHLHGPMAVRALLAGKHVYSAVPMAST